MRTLPRSRFVVARAMATMAVAGLAGAACSVSISADDGGALDGAGSDVGVDQATDSMSHAPDGSADASQDATIEASLDGGAEGAAAANDADDGQIDATQAVDAGNDATVSGDSSDGASSIDASQEDASDETDAGDAAMSSDGSASSDVGSEAGMETGACATSFMDGGGQVLFAFDDGGTTGWAASPSTSPASVLAGTTVDGNICPGAMTSSISFTSYGQNTDVEFFYNTAANWTGRTRIHAWVKIAPVGGDSSALSGVLIFVQSNNWANWSSNWTNVDASIADGGWHELVTDFTPSGGTPVVTNNVQKFGIQLVSQSTQPTGGPAVPPATVLTVDDIWLE
jgi:hypothetical protein